MTAPSCELPAECTDAGTILHVQAICTLAAPTPLPYLCCRSIDFVRSMCHMDDVLHALGLLWLVSIWSTKLCLAHADAPTILEDDDDEVLRKLLEGADAENGGNGDAEGGREHAEGEQEIELPADLSDAERAAHSQAEAAKMAELEAEAKVRVRGHVMIGCQQRLLAMVQQSSWTHLATYCTASCDACTGPGTAPDK